MNLEQQANALARGEIFAISLASIFLFVGLGALAIATLAPDTRRCCTGISRMAASTDSRAMVFCSAC